MKNLFFLFAVSLLFSCSKNANKEAEFYVRGNCNMCKERIEATVTSIPGVSSANWDENSSNMKVAFDSTKLKEIDLHVAIAASGHGTRLVEMDTNAHAELPECCQVGQKQ